MRALRLIMCLSVLALSTFLTSAQSVIGVVTDAASDEPLIGASVLIKGTQTGTVTDMDGQFTIPVSVKAGELEISYIGYQPQTVPFRADSPVSVRLQDASEQLADVVVIGYGVQKKSDLTGSVSSVDADEIRSIAATNVGQALQGKAAGVEVVQNSGAPGASVSIRIRGMGTVNNSDPLYIVDGAPMNDINYLASEDIASIEILKDAASAAIYGARAANGVVLITTKDGASSKKKIHINMNASVGFQDIIKTPNILSTEEYAYYSDYISNSYILTMMDESGKLVINPIQRDWINQGSDWWNLTTRLGMLYKAGLALSGGDKKINYYISGNYTRSDGIVKESNYQRINTKAKINIRPVDCLRMSVSMNYSGANQSIVPQGTNSVIKAAQIYSPLTLVIDDNDAYTYRTPIELLRRLTYTKTNNQFNGQFDLNWDIVPGLTFATRLSYVDVRTDVDRIQIGNTSEMTVGKNKYTVIATPTSTSDFSWDNTLTFNILDEKGHNAMTKVKDHNLSLMVGQTMEMYKYKYIYATGYGYGGYNDEFNSLSFASLEQSAKSYQHGWNALGFIARLNYNYKGRYYLQSNFRADANSRFSKKNRWGFFPSVSVGWKLTGEEWMQGQDVVSLLKIRAGWGQLGNNQIDNLSRFTLLSYNKEDYIYGNGTPTLQNGMAITQYGNENIKWERTESTTVGLDLNLSRNRFTSSFDWFIKDTKDMLIEVPIVYSSGYPNTPFQNAGSVRNTGFEIQVGWKDQIGDFRYGISGNISHIKNTVTELGQFGEPIYGGELKAPNDLGYVTRTTVGLPIACYFGYKTDGLLQETDFDEAGNPLVPVMESPTAYLPGDMKFVDVDGNGKIDENDRTLIGSPHPDLYYGINVNLGWKGLDLTMFFQGSHGNDVFNVMKYFNYSYISYDGSNNGVWGGGVPSNVNRDYLDRVFRGNNISGYRAYWGPNIGGDLPAPTSASRSKDNYAASDFYVEDGSYFRLKNIQLSYTLPKKVLQKIKFEDFTVYVSATNVFTITKYGGLDPEVGKSDGTEANNLSIGIDEGTYPQSRTFVVGMNFKL